MAPAAGELNAPQSGLEGAKKPPPDQENAWPDGGQQVGFPATYAKKSLVVAKWRQILDLARKSRRKPAPVAPRSRELSESTTTLILSVAVRCDSITAISQELGIRRATVRKVLREHGVAMPDGRGGLSAEAKSEIRSLAADGVPRKKLADMFGVSPTSIGRAIGAHQ